MPHYDDTPDVRMGHGGAELLYLECVAARLGVGVRLRRGCSQHGVQRLVLERDEPDGPSLLSSDMQHVDLASEERVIREAFGLVNHHDTEPLALSREADQRGEKVGVDEH